MSTPKGGRPKHIYHRRPWGRPLGLIAGSAVAALTFGPIDAVFRRGLMPVGDVDLTAIMTMSADYLLENGIYMVLQLTLVWWWLSFVKYRSRNAFAVTGIVLSAYPVSLIIGRNLAFGPPQHGEVLLILSAIIVAVATAGAASMLALHFAAYRRAR